MSKCIRILNSQFLISCCQPLYIPAWEKWQGWSFLDVVTVLKNDGLLADAGLKKKLEDLFAITAEPDAFGLLVLFSSHNLFHCGTGRGVATWFSGIANS